MSKAHEFIEFADRDVMSLQSKMTIGADLDLHGCSKDAQQAAEKYTKALLLSLNIPFRKLHAIGALANLLPAGHRLKATASSFDYLSGYNESGRYPAIGAAPPATVLSKAEVDSVLKDLKRFAEQVVQEMPRPRSLFVRGLLRERPFRPGRRDSVSLYVTVAQLQAALDTGTSVDQEIAALRSLMPAARQIGRLKKGKEMERTGETHVERFAFEHLIDRMRQRPAEKAALLSFKALEADEIIRRERKLSAGFRNLRARSTTLSKGVDLRGI